MADNPFQCSCQMQWIVNPSNGDRLELQKHKIQFGEIPQPAPFLRLPHLADLDKAECLVNYHGNSTAVAKLTSVPSNQFLCQYDSHCFSLCMCCDFFGCDCRMQCPDDARHRELRAHEVQESVGGGGGCLMFYRE